jgi:FkbM family methyltransferase
LLSDDMVGRGGGGVVGLIDVGSAGPLPSPWNERAGLITRLLKFEPRDRPQQAGGRVRVVDAALWEEECPRDFYVYRGRRGTGSSLFEQNVEWVREHWDEIAQRGPRRLARSWFARAELDRVSRVNCRRLDDVLAELGAQRDYHFLKIDAQGAEFPILRGAEEFLRDACIGLHLELFVLPLYRGIALLPEVESYLAERGFELVLKFPPHGSFDSQHDCLFIKSESRDPLVDAVREIYGIEPVATGTSAEPPGSTSASSASSR